MAEIRDLLLEEESESSLKKLESKLSESPLSTSEQLKLLQALDDEKDKYFAKLLQNGKSDDWKAVSELLIHLFNQERAKGGTQASSDIERNKYCQIARRVVELKFDIVTGLEEEEDADDDEAANCDNVLHLVAQHGTTLVAEEIIETVRESYVDGEAGETGVSAMLQKRNRNDKTPLGLALENADDAMVRYLVEKECKMIDHDALQTRDPFKRKEHVAFVIEKGSLERLKTLLAEDTKQYLLTATTLEIAARSGKKDIWDFIVGWNPELSNDHGVLSTAIEARQPEIVRLVLEAHPSLLSNLEKTKKAAHLVVSLIDKQKVEKRKAPQKKSKQGTVKEKPGLNSENKKTRSEESSKDSPKVQAPVSVPKTSSRQARSKLESLEEVRDTLLEYMVKHLSPRQVQNCWPRPKGQAGKEAYLELNVPSRNWAWFVQFVRTTHEEVKVIEQLRKREVEEAERKSLEQTQQQGSKEADDETLPQQRVVLPIKAPQPRTIDDPYEGLTAANFTSKYKASFQPFLKYVSFPNLDIIRKQSCANEIRHLFGQEVKCVLQWLRLVKGVTRILSLRVLDSQHEPHSEETIEESVKGLKIEELNWKRMDLSIDSILEAAPNVQILHLYSSGSWTPLRHWIGSQGLDTLNAREVHIQIIKDAISEKRANAQEGTLREWLDQSWAPRKYTVVSSLWLTAGLANSTDSDGDTAREYVSQSNWYIIPDRWAVYILSHRHNSAKTIVRLKNFIPFYEAARDLEMKVPATMRTLRRCKVCIIDTGIDESRFELGSRTTARPQKRTWHRHQIPRASTNQLEDGQENAEEEDAKKHEPRIVGATFAQTTIDSHWWLSEDSHGTQMAKLVTNLDPCCSIYVAKVGDSKSDISTGAVIEALKWAIEEGVDVVSMSFALDLHTTELHAVVKRAFAEGITMICSTADEGQNRPQAWPAAYGETMAIGACDESGERIHASSTLVDYYFLGEKVLYDSAQGLELREEISGSSVATAIAAGIASLCLSCWQIDDGVNFAESRIRNQRQSFVKKQFDTMKGNDQQNKSKYVRPWVVFGEKQRGTGEKMFLEE